VNALRRVFIRSTSIWLALVICGWDNGHMIGELLTVSAFVLVGLLMLTRWWEERP
jgi:hypothetical protein